MDRLRGRRVALVVVTLCTWASAWTFGPRQAWAFAERGDTTPEICPMRHVTGTLCPMHHSHDTRTVAPDGASRLTCGCPDEAVAGLVHGPKVRLAVPAVVATVESAVIVGDASDPPVMDEWTPPLSPPPRA